MDSALAPDPAFYHAYEHRAQVYSHFGRNREALASADSARRLSDGDLGLAVSALVLARAGDTVGARRLIDGVRNEDGALARLGREERFWLYGAQVALGDLDVVVDALASERLRGIGLWFRLQSPDFDPIRAHPTFRRIAEGARPASQRP